MYKERETEVNRSFDDGRSPVIVCANLTKSYRATVALSGVSLEVGNGSLFGLLGPNGAGKSTLVKILTGLVRPGGGLARVLGGEPADREVRRRLGYLPEHFRFPGWLTGRELLEFHARLIGVRSNVQGLLDLVGVGGASDRKIAGYSKGMQQRLGLAQALVGKPELVFLDEPTSALDPLGRQEVRDVLLTLRGRGVTVFLNSHLLTEVEKVCDRVAVISRGTVLAVGPIGELVRGAEVRLRVGEAAPSDLEKLRERVAQAGTPSPSYDSGELRFAADSEDEVPALVRMAVESGLSVYEAGLVRPSLEEIFVRLIRGHGMEATG